MGNHQRGISAADRAHAAQKEYENKAKLISTQRQSIRGKTIHRHCQRGRTRARALTSHQTQRAQILTWNLSCTLRMGNKRIAVWKARGAEAEEKCALLSCS